MKNENKISAFDIETTGLNPNRNTEVFAYAIYYPDENKFIIKRKDTHKDFLTYLQKYFNDTSIIKVCHNFKFEYSFCRKIINIPKETKWECTLLMSQLVKNIELSHALDYQYKKLTKDFSFDSQDEKVFAYRNKGYNLVQPVLFNEYQKSDVFRTYILYSVFLPEMKQKNLMKLYKKEIVFGQIVCDMEDHGINLHLPNTDNLLNYLKDEQQKLLQDFYKETGSFVNPSSGKQVENLLINRYNLPVLQYTKKGNTQINKDVIFKYKENYPDLKILDMIIKWRSFKTGLSVIKSYRDIYTRYGRICPIINPNRATTGRQSAQDPNLQNVQKPEALKNLFPVNARQCFCCDNDSYMIFADYKGMEIRLITELTQEPIYLDMINNESGDPHDYAARLLLEDKYNGEKILRDACKNAQFATAYGAGKSKVEKTVNLKDINYYGFKRKLPKIGYFTKNILYKAREGFIINPFGRILYINPEQEYSIGNHLIQSTAADILKEAIIRVHKYINDYWKKYLHLIISIHDELGFSITKKLYSSKFDIIKKDITKLMTEFDEIQIPLKLEWKKTETTWDKAVVI